ncbi:DUF1707 domain-containing protein [Streptomyces varsoviensis]|uniref:DUF1707 domain-containing protein n=1 Tax=Streptomyces varsoviensis TaxID=67373 RepID=UPI0033E6FBD2
MPDHAATPDPVREPARPAAQAPAAQAPAVQAPAAQAPAVRASDQERDAAAALLADALALGRISAEEHSDRLEAVYQARTRAELVPLTADLPAPEPGRALADPVDSEPLTALFSKIRRGGQLPVPPHSVVHARFGAVVLDLRHAVFTRREVVIDANSFCGKIEILLPDEAQVYDTGTALFGKRSLPGKPPKGGTEGPVVRITGRSVFGHVRLMRNFKWPWREWR